MFLGKHLDSSLLWMPLLAGMGLSTNLAANAGIAASPTSETLANLASLAHPLLVPVTLDSQSVVPSTVRDMARLQTNSLDSTVFSLVGNDKKNKKNKHNEGDDEGNGDHGERDRDRNSGRTGAVSVQMMFGDRDRGIIRDYCSQPHSNLPPGLAKRGGQLPPGLEKHLRRNGQLPPGLQKKMYRFPAELERRLPPLPNNYVRVFVGGRGLIVDAQFNIIDIIDVFR